MSDEAATPAPVSPEAPIKEGDAITYKVGRNRGRGTVKTIGNHLAVLVTEKGKEILRKVDQLIRA